MPHSLSSLCEFDSTSQVVYLWFHYQDHLSTKANNGQCLTRLWQGSSTVIPKMLVSKQDEKSLTKCNRKFKGEVPLAAQRHYLAYVTGPRHASLECWLLRKPIQRSLALPASGLGNTTPVQRFKFHAQ